MFFLSQANHTPVESNKKPNNNSINKNKQTRACFLVLGRCLCVWDTAGLNSTVPSLCNWFRKLQSFTYSFISFSLFTSLCSGSLRHTRFNHMLSNAAAPHHDETHWNTSHGHVLWAVSVYWFPPPSSTLSLSPSHFPFTEIYDNPLCHIQGVKVCPVSVILLTPSGKCRLAHSD